MYQSHHAPNFDTISDGLGGLVHLANIFDIMTCYDMLGGTVGEVIVYNLLMEVFVCILREFWSYAF